MPEQIINVKSKVALGIDSKTYEVLCDVQREDGVIDTDQTRTVTEKWLEEYIARRRQETGKTKSKQEDE